MDQSFLWSLELGLIFFDPLIVCLLCQLLQFWWEQLRSWIWFAFSCAVTARFVSFWRSPGPVVAGCCLEKHYPVAPCPVQSQSPLLVFPPIHNYWKVLPRVREPLVREESETKREYFFVKGSLWCFLTWRSLKGCMLTITFTLNWSHVRQ